MQDYTNYNQPQSASADNYYHDPLEGAGEPERQADDQQPQMLNQDPGADVEPVHRDDANVPDGKYNNPELESYLDTTKKLLEKTRKERNNLIVRIDEEEDNITDFRKQSKSPIPASDALYNMRTELGRKEDLIRALIEVVRSLE